MSALHMVELRPDLTALMLFLRDQGLSSSDGDDDLGYGIHAWLAAAFGPFAPKPWRLLLDRRRPPRILGYSSYEVNRLRERLHEFAEPGVFAVCPDPETMVTGKKMPEWHTGRSLAFQVQCCPVGRKADSGVEKDLFLIRADASGQQPLMRDAVYCEWVRERLERDGAATIMSVRLEGFRLVRQSRRGNRDGNRRPPCHIVRPQALFQGSLTVGKPDAFSSLLVQGVGRHRSFGYGMLLLRPPS